MISKQLIGVFPILLVLVLLSALACGSPAATATPEPAAALTVAEPATKPTATPVVEAAPVPEAPEVRIPTGTLNVGTLEMGRFTGHPSLSHMPALLPVNAIPVGESLMSMDKDTNIVPMLASEWSVSEDFITWTFKLQQGVQFHKGYGEMTADDVVWSYEHWNQNDRLGRVENSRAFWQATGGFVETPDLYTIVVHTGEPVPDLMLYDFMVMPRASGTWVASKRQTEEIGVEAADLNIAATGPWEIVEHRTAQFWQMKAVENHWRQTPYFAELRYWEIPEESARVAGFQTGNLDTFDMSMDSIALVESVPGARLMQVPNAGAQGLQFYGQYYLDIGTPDQRPGYDPNLPWVSADPEIGSLDWERSVKVRKALSIAIDREALIEELLWGYGRPVLMRDWAGPGEYQLPGQWEYSPERAKQLLAEAGYPNGFSIDLTTGIRGAPAEEETCEAIATMWGDIGVNARLQRTPYVPLRATFYNRSHQGAVCQSASLRLSPVLAFISHTDAGSFNHGTLHPFLEEKIPQARLAIDPAEREALEVEIGRFFLDNAVTTLGLYAFDTLWPVGPRIEPWDEYVKHYDVQLINGFEYIRHRE